MAAKQKCQCAPCISRRKAQNKYFDKNKEKLLKQHAEWNKKNRKIKKNEPTDEELDKICARMLGR